jgi:ubiquilin
MSSTVKGPSEMKLSISISPSKSVGELKDEIASKSDVEKERQRLIYSGKSRHGLHSVGDGEASC